MADMADYYLDIAFDDMLEDEEDGDGPPISPKTCRCCGTKDLYWGSYNGKWRLFDENRKLHICSKVPLKD